MNNRYAHALDTKVLSSDVSRHISSLRNQRRIVRAALDYLVLLKIAQEDKMKVATLESLPHFSYRYFRVMLVLSLSVEKFRFFDRFESRAFVVPQGAILLCQFFISVVPEKNI